MWDFGGEIFGSEMREGRGSGEEREDRDIR